jgi:transcriptional repressor NF-X1
LWPPLLAQLSSRFAYSLSKGTIYSIYTTHPGPCPPCILTVHTSCHCNRTVLSIRCARSHTAPEPSLSCGQTCGRPLLCGSHYCEKQCHPGQCEPCTETEISKCFCGKNSTQVPCGERKSSKQQALVIDKNGRETTWEGRYDCGNKCNRYATVFLCFHLLINSVIRAFDCGLHTCSKVC